MSKAFFTAKHFIVIADIISQLEVDKQEDKDKIIEYFADRLSVTNERFKRDMFIKDCTTSGE